MSEKIKTENISKMSVKEIYEALTEHQKDEIFRMREYEYRVEDITTTLERECNEDVNSEETQKLIKMIARDIVYSDYGNYYDSGYPLTVNIHNLYHQYKYEYKTA